MIRINLLPRTAIKAGSSIRNQAIVAGVAIVLSLNGILFIPKFGYFPIKKEGADYDAKIKKADDDLKQVQAYRNQLEEIKKLNNSIQEKLKIIGDIEKKRTGPVWLLDQMTDAVSRFRVIDAQTGKETWKYVDDAGKVFLNRFDITGNKLSIDGIAINNTYLVAFLNNLKNKKDLFVPESVILYFSDQTTFQGALVRSFKITADVNLMAKPEVGGSAAASQTPEQTGSAQPSGSPTSPATTPAPTNTTPTAQAPKPK